MTTWIIEPRDPLIIRDGRPFGPDPGARARSLGFPFPSTTTGGVRNKAGLDSNGTFDRDAIPRVKELAVRGPLLVELTTPVDGTAGDIRRWLAPAPADALLLAADSSSSPSITRQQLLPLAPVADAQTNVPADADLLLVGMPHYNPAKPYSKAPRFWDWEALSTWLLRPTDGPVDPKQLGVSGPEAERRMHVSIQFERQTAAEGALFQTSGLEFTGAGQERFALAVAADDDFPHFSGGLAPLGGERRLMGWRRSAAGFPTCPPELRAAIVARRACRVVLLTPACFAAGYRPTWLLEPREGVTSRLRAAATGRPQVVSGWDAEHNRPKPTRRLAPAGAVFFVTLEGAEADIGQWVDTHWMQSVSDSEQDRRDGFGLAAIGIWSGTPRQMEGYDASA